MLRERRQDSDTTDHRGGAEGSILAFYKVGSPTFMTLVSHSSEQSREKQACDHRDLLIHTIFILSMGTPGRLLCASQASLVHTDSSSGH